MKRVRRIATLFLVLSLVLGLCAPAMAASDSATGTTLRLEETTGAVTVKTASGQEKKVTKDMRLLNGYTVETGKNSTAYISLDGSKAVKLDALGKIEVKKTGKQLEVLLTSGQVFFSVTEKLKADEALNIRSATMVTGIRGSFGWMNWYEVGLMHGSANVSSTDSATGVTAVASLTSGQMVTSEQMAAAVEQAVEQAQQAQQTGAAPEAQTVAVAAETKEITVEDVPAIAAEEVKENVEMQQQLAQDTKLNVQEMNESVEQKQAAEAAKVEEAEKTVEAAALEQESAITASTAADKAAGVQETIPFVESTSTGGGAAGGGAAGGGAAGGGGGGYYYNDDSGDSGSDTVNTTPATTNYRTVNVNVVKKMHCTVTAQASYSVPEGGSFSFTVIPDSGYDGGYVAYAFTNEHDASYAVSKSNGVGTVTVSNVRADTTLSFTSVCAKRVELTSETTSFTEVQQLLQSNDSVELVLSKLDGGANANEHIWTPSDTTLSVEPNRFLQISGGSLRMPGGAIHVQNGGELRVDSSAVMDGFDSTSNSTGGELYVENGGSFTGAGEVVLKKIHVQDNGELHQIGSLLEATEEMTVIGTVYNHAKVLVAQNSKIQIKNSGKFINNNSGVVSSKGVIEVEAGGTFKNEGTVQNYGEIINRGTFNGSVENYDSATVRGIPQSQIAQKKICTVSFYDTSSSVVPTLISTTMVTSGNAPMATQFPTLTNTSEKEFKAWYWDAACTSPYQNTAISDDTALYAGWTYAGTLKLSNIPDYFTVTSVKNGSTQLSETAVSGVYQLPLSASTVTVTLALDATTSSYIVVSSTDVVGTLLKGTETTGSAVNFTADSSTYSSSGMSLAKGESYTLRVADCAYFKVSGAAGAAITADDINNALGSHTRVYVSGSAVTIAASKELTVPQYQSLCFASDLTVEAGGTLTNNGVFLNYRTLTTNVAGADDSKGTITNNGTLTNYGTIINKGAFTNQTDGQVDISTGATFNQYGDTSQISGLPTTSISTDLPAISGWTHNAVLNNQGTFNGTIHSWP